MKFATYIIVALGSGAVALPGPVSRRWDQQETANGRRSLTHWLAAGTCYIIPHSWCSPKITSAAIEPTAVADAEPRATRALRRARPQPLMLRSHSRRLSKPVNSGSHGYRDRRNGSSEQTTAQTMFEAPPNHPTELLDWQEGTYEPVLGSVGQCQYAPWIASYPDVLCGTARHCKSYHIGYMNDDMYRTEQDCLDSHRPAP
ncbi:hypothetical protein ACCO45_012438 [Purpureocillium lilacinum]|uniref:Uncharacterized protein n=1 Tax=Purpureocillium lilacinum TaxID=33203 RepID=A0ACC4D805_PURLI